MVIYRIISPTGKSYIGCTSRSLSDRMKAHKYKALSGNSKVPFHCAIRKYGIEAMKIEILFETDSHEELLKKEISYIKEYNTISPNGYNLTKGGEGTLGLKSNLGIKRTVEQKTKYKEINMKHAKKCVLVNCKEKWFKIYDSIAALAKENNLNYGSIKQACSRKTSIHDLKVILQENFIENDKNLYVLKTSKIFKITNGIETKNINSLLELRKVLNISQRQSINMFHFNKVVKGWSVCG